MRIGRFVTATAILFLIALVWNAFVHLLVLREIDAAVAHLRRDDGAGALWLTLLVTAGVCTMFVLGYTRVARTGSLREGLLYGLWFALLAGLLVDLNQYALYPVPGRVAAAWFAGGVLEFSLYGALVTRLYPARSQERPGVPGVP